MHRKTERRVVPRERFINRIVQPSAVAKFERELSSLRKLLQEGAQAIEVRLPRSGKLEQNGTQLVSQTGGPLHEQRQRLLRILQLLDMGDVAAGLDGKQEAIGHALAPVDERLL